MIILWPILLSPVCFGSPHKVPRAPQFISGSQVGPINVCADVADGGMACVNPSWFVLCRNGAANSATQFCSPGNVCCNGQCVLPGSGASCPTICAGEPDQSISCSSSTSYSVCLGGAVITKPQACAEGTVCCSNACVFESDIACGAPSDSLLTPDAIQVVIVPTPANSCSGIPDNNIACKSMNSYNYCLAGESLRTPDLPCPIGTICCPSLNTCTTASKCDKAYSSKCASIPDDGILCASLNTYDVCLSNNILESAQNQTCPQGTVCCADGINRCDFRFNCGAVLPMTSVVEATSFLPKINPAANVCTSVADNVQACINPTIITTCLQGHAASLGQACQKGTKCCAGNCVPPGSPSCNTCNGVPNAEIACTSVDSYTICMNQNPLTVPQKCAKGTVCCGNACVSIKDPACVAEVPVVSNLGVIESSQPLLLKSMSVQSLNDDICRGLTDNNIACLTATTFVFCSGKSPASAEYSCPHNSVCCPSTNSCIDTNECHLTLQSSCSLVSKLRNRDLGAVLEGWKAAIRDIHHVQLCTSKTTYNICVDGNFSSQPDIVCPVGQVCDMSVNACVHKINAVETMGPLLELSAPTLIPSSGNLSVCNSIPDYTRICVNPNTFTTCVKEVPLFHPSSCSPGTRCYNGLCVPFNHPSYNPCYGMADKEPVCTSATAYGICKNQMLASPPIPCINELSCCQNSCVERNSSMCGFVAVGQELQPATANPSTDEQEEKISGCSNISDNDMACKTFEAFDYCLNGTWMNATETSCPIGTHCCGDTNTCVIPGICKTKLPSRCDRVPNGTMLCLSDTMYGICQNGALSSTNPETCPSGFVCCESRNACTSPAACKFLMPPALQSLSSVKTFIKLSPVENVCDQVSSNSMACLNPSHYTICMNGVPSTLAAQCSPSQKCCNNSCVDPKDRSCNVCAVATDFSIACISNTSFTVCLKNQMLTVPEKCPEGTVCCGNACTQPGTTLCGAL